MQVGDLVRCHVGTSRSTGVYGVDYHEEIGTIVGDVRLKPVGSGYAWGEDVAPVLLPSGKVTNFHITRLEVVS
jgi:hypothetical protein